MKIGVLAFITETSIDTMTFARKAESLGFDSFFLPEHPIIPVVRKSAYPASADGVMPEGLAHFIDPFIGLAQAVAVTSRIELGIGGADGESAGLYHESRVNRSDGRHYLGDFTRCRTRHQLRNFRLGRNPR
jgi:hypothetical protein